MAIYCDSGKTMAVMASKEPNGNPFLMTFCVRQTNEKTLPKIDFSKEMSQQKSCVIVPF